MERGTETGSDRVTLFLAGDVMIGRGVDQVLPQSAPPALHERHVESARRYVDLAEEASGPIRAPVSVEYPWGEALDELDRMDPDVRVVNLETAVTTSDDAWPGKGIHYRTHPDNVGCLVAAGIDAVSLANNHVLDWGRDGLRETLDTLEAAGVRPAGAGRDLASARAPAAVDVRDLGRRVLVHAAATPTSGVPPDWAAGPREPGVNLLPELTGAAARGFARRVRESRGEGDLVVASLHWGGNWGYEVPAEQRRFARRLVAEADVDVVHGHSSHHPKGLELHRERLILHGCGDLLNDYEGIAGHERYRPDLAVLYLPVLEGSTGRLVRLEMAPVRIRRFRLERAPDEAARWLRDRLARESGRLDGLRLRLGDHGRLVARPADG